MRTRTRTGPPPRIKRQTVTAAEAAYLPPFEYECSGGVHMIGASHPVERCPMFVKGEPCTGTLRRVGKGARS